MIDEKPLFSVVFTVHSFIIKQRQGKVQCPLLLEREIDR